MDERGLFDASTPVDSQAYEAVLGAGSATWSDDDVAPEPEPEDFETAWEQTRIDVVTPAEKVFVTMVGDHDIEVRFMPGWYHRASTDEIATEFARAAKLVYVRRSREWYGLQSRQSGKPVEPTTEVFDEQGADYRRRLEQLSAQGQSADGTVVMSMVGMTHYVFVIAPGVNDRLSEAAFIQASREAALACFADWTRAWKELKFDVYFRPFYERAGML